jgi:hypothetical protein
MFVLLGRKVVGRTEWSFRWPLDGVEAGAGGALVVVEWWWSLVVVVVGMGDGRGMGVLALYQ